MKHIVPLTQREVIGVCDVVARPTVGTQRSASQVLGSRIFKVVGEETMRGKSFDGRWRWVNDDGSVGESCPPPTDDELEIFESRHREPGVDRQTGSANAPERNRSDPALVVTRTERVASSAGLAGGGASATRP